MGSSGVLVLSDARVDLITDSLKHIRISDKKTTTQPDLAPKSKIKLTDSQDVRQCCSCGISTCKKHVDDLVPDKSYFLMLAVKLVDERILAQCLRGVTILLQHISEKLLCICFDFFTCWEESFRRIQPVIVIKSSPCSTD